MSVVTLVTPDPAWSQQFEGEAQKILRALGGWAWEGGQVYLLEHVGSTSVPGLLAKPCIDIVIGVYPFPLGQPFLEALGSLGYSYKGENGIEGRHYFQLGPHDVHIHMYEIGHGDIGELLLFRNYLRDSEEARHRYETLKQRLAQHSETRVAYTDGKAPLIQTLLQEAQMWYSAAVGFQPVDFLVNELEGVGVPWCVASGWSLDLVLNKVTRFHDDIDVCIWRSDQQRFLSHLKARGWKLHVPVDGKYRPWQDGEFLELPMTQIHARRGDMPFELLDILLMESNSNDWIYRRDPKVTMPKEQVMVRVQDIYVLHPAITLLFKSRTSDKDPRAKDQKDFEAVLPALTSGQKDWLDEAFETWMPEHPWRKVLTRR
jgi:GrpB-like predicted nucleotidyltransferase (UPF0157 family)